MTSEDHSSLVVANAIVKQSVSSSCRERERKSTPFRIFLWFPRVHFESTTFLWFFLGVFNVSILLFYCIPQVGWRKISQHLGTSTHNKLHYWKSPVWHCDLDGNCVFRSLFVSQSASKIWWEISIQLCHKAILDRLSIAITIYTFIGYVWDCMMSGVSLHYCFGSGWSVGQYNALWSEVFWTDTHTSMSYNLVILPLFLQRGD